MDISVGIVLCLLGIWLIFISIQHLYFKRGYWFYPTISGFKNRKKRDLDWGAYLQGVFALFFGLFFLYLGFRFFFD